MLWLVELPPKLKKRTHLQEPLFLFAIRTEKTIGRRMNASKVRAFARRRVQQLAGLWVFFFLFQFDRSVHVIFEFEKMVFS